MLGSVINSYRITRKIGAGGMGIVYAAQHVELKKRAAVKVLNQSQSEREDTAKRFINEAKAAASIRDPGIVDVIDVGHHKGKLYILMEFLDGESLASRLRRAKKLSEREAVLIIKQASETLGIAHQQGIIHRDLKPDNIFLVPDRLVVGEQRVKLLDFGIAKLKESNGLETRSGIMLGTPAYMSPEQCRGAKNVDHRSDLYSLGIIMFQMLCGRRPFRSDTDIGYLHAHQHEVTPSVAQFNDTISVEIEAIVARLLEKEPDARYHSAFDLVQALSAVQTIGMTSQPFSVNGFEVTGSDIQASGIDIQASGIDSQVGSGRHERPLSMHDTQPTKSLAGKAVEPATIELNPSSIEAFERSDRTPTQETTVDKSLEVPEHKPRTFVASTLALLTLVGLVGVFWLWPRSEPNATWDPGKPARSRHVTSVDAMTSARDSTSENARSSSGETVAKAVAEKRAASRSLTEMVTLEGGSFKMGSPPDERYREEDEGPRHAVTVSPFAIGKYEVTQGQWKMVMGSSPDNCKRGCGDDFPVENISWLSAVEFLNKLSERQGLRPCYRILGDQIEWDRSCQGYRLPTEAEWEFAARAGTATAYSFGDNPAGLRAYAWYHGTDSRIHPAGQKTASKFGLHDIYGNVSEWVWDWYGAYTPGEETDPTGPLSGRYRVVRGGSVIFDIDSGVFRSASREWLEPRRRKIGVGVRYARSLPGRR
ncbi:MAG: bifunctional serine/threonine-protein kinase/formylglycine-generating enzyme family protein [Proteobacteria bacterium]|nr:bifunctional serine/threonine-protein kinase/formylglycine-generating enzyme family protein [Pseudomonadota bacterium]